MKSLNSFFIFRSSRPNLPSSYISHDCRLTVGSPSGMDAKWKLKLVSVLVLILTVGSGNAWGDPVTIFQETFGDNGGNNTAYGSATCYTATASMFTTGSAATNYSGSGSVGKGDLQSPNYSSGYTDASGKSGCYQSGTASTTRTIIQISNIKITGYSSLHLSFGALGGSNSHTINVYYKIDSGLKTQIITNGSLSSTSWSLKEADISETGTNLTLYFEHTPTRNWLMRLDDIIVTGTAAETCTPLGSINGSISLSKEKHSGLTQTKPNTRLFSCLAKNQKYT